MRCAPSLLGLTLFLALAACTSDSSQNEGDASTDAAGQGDAGSICDRFTHSGSPCSPVSPAICFRSCKADGCSCVAGADGTGVWRCVTDFSCVPEAGPLDDAGALADVIEDARSDG